MAMHSYSWLLTTRGLGEDISQLLESVFSTLAQEHSFFCDYRAQTGVGTLMRTDTGYELTVTEDRLALNAINLAAQQGRSWLVTTRCCMQASSGGLKPSTSSL